MKKRPMTFLLVVAIAAVLQISPTPASAAAARTKNVENVVQVTGAAVVERYRAAWQEFAGYSVPWEMWAK